MKNKSVFWIVLIFFFSFCVSLVINTPVTELFRFIKAPSELRISGLTGTILTGHAEQVSYSGIQLDNMAYAFQPLCLVRLSICYHVSADNETSINFDHNLLVQSQNVNNSHILISDELIQNSSGLLVIPTGELYLSIDNITYAGGVLTELKLDLEWRGAGIQGEEQVLGDYLAEITSVKESLNMVFKESENLLAINGTINVNREGDYRVDLKLESQPELKPSIESAVELFAQKTDLDKYTIKHSGRISNKYKNYLSVLQ